MPDPPASIIPFIVLEWGGKIRISALKGSKGRKTVEVYSMASAMVF